MNFIFHRRWRLATGLVIAGLLALACCPPARAQERPTEYQVKAAFLFHFGQFVEWPNNFFPDATRPFVIGIFGDTDPFHGDLQRIVAGKTIFGHPVETREVRTLTDLQGCQILFIPASEKSQEEDALKAAAGLNILTVGETDDFCSAGGMIQFVIEDDQVHFRINSVAARANGLKISSKLLTLARQPKDQK